MLSPSAKYTGFSSEPSFAKAKDALNQIATVTAITQLKQKLRTFFIASLFSKHKATC